MTITKTNNDDNKYIKYNNISLIEKKFNICIKFSAKYEQIVLEIFNLMYLTQNKLSEFDMTDSIILYIIGLYYQFEKRDYFSAIKYFEKSMGMGNSYALYSLAIYHYFIEHHYEKSIEYYLKILSIENSPVILRLKSIFNIGLYYQRVEKNYGIMKKYYFELLDLINSLSNSHLSDDKINSHEFVKKIKSKTTFNLGYYYQYTEPNYVLMKRYYLISINLFNSKASNNMGLYYQHIENNYLKMLEYYLKSIQLSNHKSLINLELYYLNANQTKIFYEQLKKLEPNQIIIDKLNQLNLKYLKNPKNSIN